MQVIGGWEVSPIVSFRTGFPLPVYGAQDESGTFGSRCASRLQWHPVDYARRTNRRSRQYQWFTNNGQFTQPAAGTFGNCSPQLGSLRSPHYTDVDLSVHKNFPTYGAVPLAVPNRLHQRFQPCPAQRTEHEPGSHDGTDHQRPTPKEHTAGAETLLLKTEHV